MNLIEDRGTGIPGLLRKMKEYGLPELEFVDMEIPPSISASSFVGYLKGKSTLTIFKRHVSLKYKYGNRHFLCKGYKMSPKDSPGK